jgi:hypothetical protein
MVPPSRGSKRETVFSGQSYNQFYNTVREIILNYKPKGYNEYN